MRNKKKENRIEGERKKKEEGESRGRRGERREKI